MRLAPRGLALVACVTAAAAVATAIWQADRPALVDFSGGDVVRVGVSPGVSLYGYAESSRRELQALAAAGAPESYALVTLSGYFAPGELAPILDGVTLI